MTNKTIDWYFLRKSNDENYLLKKPLQKPEQSKMKKPIRKWFVQQRLRNCSSSGDMIKIKAKEENKMQFNAISKDTESVI